MTAKTAQSSDYGVVTAEMLSDGTDITRLTLTIGTGDTITLTFASASQFAVADIKATLGLAKVANPTKKVRITSSWGNWREVRSARKASRRTRYL